MKLKIIGSNSKGNSYLLENDNEALLIECGVKLPVIKKAINYNLSKILGCIVTHEHQDHCVSIKEVMKAGVDVYASKGTLDILNCSGHRANVISSKTPFSVGGFKVLPFDAKHDAAEPLGFLINHIETGNVLFITDSYYCPYIFDNLNNIIVEANFSEKIIDSKMEKGSIAPFLRDRILKSHMSLETCKKLLKSNDLSKVNNIVLIHLSDGNSDETQFVKEVKELTCKNVYAANAGMTIDFDKRPF
ncbi:MBL fold metallo-hydrolase [Flavicella sediminum]|uniref:MBL fold metallo-hydrolase n=1 Tax=Flavicella sediminum TaxID=2585141 RepID=UPI00112412C7|nr:MBL fold metallo-hydrolase [Flavicella sediminum]